MNLSDIENAFAYQRRLTTHKPAYYPDYHLSIAQRSILSITVLILAVFAIAFNMATLVVSFKSSRIRPLFRTCLISLATSDLIGSSVVALDYLTAFFSPFPQLWTLGRTMCHLMPFLKVLANLVNSMTLVGISLDRYLSIRHILKNTWDPGAIYCFIICLVVWGTSAAIAVPTYAAYQHYPVIIVNTDAYNTSEIIGYVPGYICAAPKSMNARYYIFLFGILFLPMVVAFIWFNSSIAWDILKRIKNKPGSKANKSKDPSAGNDNSSRTQPKPTTITFPTDSSMKASPAQVVREKRQKRMLWIVLLLMIVFLALKLPEWIYLIITFYSLNYSETPMLLSFVFGIISMSNSVFNPLLYAFVTQTIQYLMDFYRCILDFCCMNCKRGVKAFNSVGLGQVEGNPEESKKSECKEKILVISS